jgi:hypothetical protein
MNEKILKDFKDLVIHQLYYSNLSGQGYVVNVKLHTWYDKDSVMQYFEHKEDNFLKNKISDWLDDTGENGLTEIFWDEIRIFQEDMTELAQFDRNEIDKINSKIVWTGKSGGYIGFDFFPDVIIMDYENGDIEDDIMLDHIEEIKQINNVLTEYQKQAKAVDFNYMISEYIEYNILEELETEIAEEKKFSDIMRDQAGLISTINNNLSFIGLEADYKLKK